MKEKLLEHRKTMMYIHKEAQQDELFSNIARMLFVASAKVKECGGEKDMFDAINRIEDLEAYLKVVAGQHGDCLRPTCNFKGHANFFKAEDSQIWLYRCPCCQAGDETITLAELILEVFKRKYPGCRHRTIVQLIRRTFDVDYSKPFYRELEVRTNHNLEVLKNAPEGSYLQKLVKKRKLVDFYQNFAEVALMYTAEDNFDYSFYASRSVILEYFNELERQSKSNAIIEKVNLLADLGFINKIDFNDIPEVYKDKVKYFKESKEYYIKEASAYQTAKITEEQLVKAEEYARAVITNKIYRNKVSIEDSIKETTSFTKDEEKFLDRANKAIEDELKSKGYIALSTLASKIDKKGKYYKKAEKDAYLELLLDRVLLEANVKKITATETNKKKYNMKRVVDKEVILIKDDKEVEISARIRVEESVRVAKRAKSEQIKAKKATTKKTRKPKKNVVRDDKYYEEEVARWQAETEAMYARIVETFKDKDGSIMARFDDGSVEMIDIPF